MLSGALWLAAYQAWAQPTRRAASGRRPARAATYQKRWGAVAKTVAAVNETFAARYPRMLLSCDGEGGGRAECQAERARFNAAMMPLLLARDAEVLQLEAAALEEERTALAAQVRSADQHLLAAQYGAASQELGNPTHIAMLDGYIINDIQVFATKFEEVVKRAAIVSRCGTQFLASASGCCAAQ